MRINPLFALLLALAALPSLRAQCPCVDGDDCRQACIGGMCLPCTSDADCTGSRGVCDVGSGRCFECATDGDCPMGSAGCGAGFCQAVCNADDDCPVPANECRVADCLFNTFPVSLCDGTLLIINATCRVIERAGSDTDLCNSGAGECMDGDCVPLTPCNCTAGTDCSRACLGGMCTPCTANADCTDTTRPICQTTKGRCVECLADGDCSPPDTHCLIPSPQGVFACVLCERGVTPCAIDPDPKDCNLVRCSTPIENLVKCDGVAFRQNDLTATCPAITVFLDGALCAMGAGECMGGDCILFTPTTTPTPSNTPGLPSASPTPTSSNTPGLPSASPTQSVGFPSASPTATPGLPTPTCTCTSQADCDGSCKGGFCRDCSLFAGCASPRPVCGAGGDCVECVSDSDCPMALPKCITAIGVCALCASDADCPDDSECRVGDCMNDFGQTMFCDGMGFTLGDSTCDIVDAPNGTPCEATGVCLNGLCVSPTPTPTTTPSNTQTMSSGMTPSNTGTPTPSNTRTPTPSNTRTPSTTRSASNTPTPSNTGTPTPSTTKSASNTPTPSNTGTPTPSNTGTPTPSNTGTPTSSNTGTPTPTGTPTTTPSRSAFPTPGFCDDGDACTDDFFSFDIDPPGCVNEPVISGCIDCTVNATGCTRSKGFWKNHFPWPEDPGTPGPEEENVLCDFQWQHICNPRLCWFSKYIHCGGAWWWSNTHSCELTCPGKRLSKGGKAWLNLAQQWIAARLNMLDGACVTPEILDKILEVEELLEDNCDFDDIDSALRAQFEQCAAILEKYNNGKITVSCDDDDDDDDDDNDDNDDKGNGKDDDDNNDN